MAKRISHKTVESRNYFLRTEQVFNSKSQLLFVLCILQNAIFFRIYIQKVFFKKKFKKLSNLKERNVVLLQMHIYKKWQDDKGKSSRYLQFIFENNKCFLKYPGRF